MYRESSRRIFVGHLDPATTQETVRAHFSKFGKLCECTLKKAARNNQTQAKCFAFVAYQERAHATKCLAALHQIDKREIDVKPAVEEVDHISEKMVMPAKLFVGALPVSCDSEKLQNAFKKYGTIINSTVMNDRRSNRSRLFGFVEFHHEESVRNVLEDYWSHFIDDKWVETKRCVPKFTAADQDEKKRLPTPRQYGNVSSSRLLEARISERRRAEREVRENCESEAGTSKQHMLANQAMGTEKWDLEHNEDTSRGSSSWNGSSNWNGRRRVSSGRQAAYLNNEWARWSANTSYNDTGVNEWTGRWAADLSLGTGSVLGDVRPVWRRWPSDGTAAASGTGWDHGHHDRMSWGSAVQALY